VREAQAIFSSVSHLLAQNNLEANIRGMINADDQSQQDLKKAVITANLTTDGKEEKTQF
jgi:hypothetical protein